MTIILVRQRTEVPAIDGMIAGMVAVERDAAFLTLVTGGAGLGRYDCALHVLAEGELVANGVFWAEWASRRFVGLPVQAAAVARHPHPTVVVSINPAIPAQAAAGERIAYHADLAGRPLEVLEVEQDGGIFAVRSPGETAVLSRWTRDKFGRPLRLDGRPAIDASRTLHLLLVGDESLLRDTYPANIAALGDAAEHFRLDLEFSFWNPRNEPLGRIAPALDGVDGIVLPGGSDMEQVPGQIDVAQLAIRRDIPTVGLCLGMQTMATAVAREIGGYNDANMEEADPAAQIKTFIRLRDEHGRPEFRLGLRRTRVVPGTVLSTIFDGAAEVEVHCNHRYVLDPALHDALGATGLALSAMQKDRNFADAVEVSSLRFFVGMQGHPELMSRRGVPQPLLTAFLRAAGEFQPSAPLQPQ